MRWYCAVQGGRGCHRAAWGSASESKNTNMYSCGSLVPRRQTVADLADTKEVYIGW